MSEEWNPWEDCDGGDWPTGEQCISCKAWNDCTREHVNELKQMERQDLMVGMEVRDE